MGTTPSSTSSLFAPQVFSGVSQFSSDFQSILQRAVSIAELPIQTLQNQQSDLLQQKQLLIGLNTAAASLGSSLGALGSLGANQGLSAASSNSSTVSVTNSGATSPATYTISNITSVAAAAAETSVSGFADSTSAHVSATGIMKLVVGSSTYAINLASGQNNLNGLADAINSLGAGVTASVLTTGTGGT
ncbi:MAG TPA: flagellar cap protein FliD N-terminal domain-containing protein, partial [Verrucomicrobiae bacterium]|nr:flagellar cap protein FliD N-terminal domain-containing protein [Verrucomicrobiae bacterium]